jgi:hypothetical protein
LLKLEIGENKDMIPKAATLEQVSRCMGPGASNEMIFMVIS